MNLQEALLLNVYSIQVKIPTDDKIITVQGKCYANVLIKLALFGVGYIVN